MYLPLGAYNTGLKSYVRDELRSNARAAVEKAKSSAVEAANLAAGLREQLDKGTAPADADGAIAVANLGRGSRGAAAAEKVAAAARWRSVLADKHLAATVAELASIEARLAADNCAALRHSDRHGRRRMHGRGHCCD